MIKILNENMNLLTLMKALGVVVVYMLLARITGHYLVSFGSDNCFYIADGVALAVLLLGGKHYIWGVCLGAFIANKLMGYPYGLGAIRAVGSSLGVLCSFLLITRNDKFKIALQSCLDYLYLVGGAAAGSMVGAVVTVTASWWAGILTLEAFPVQLFNGWMGEVLGAFLVTSVVLVWWPIRIEQFLIELPSESLLAIGLTFLAGQVISWGWLPATFTQENDGIWMLPFIAWAAIRLGIKEMTVILLIGSIQVLWTVQQNFGLTDKAVLNPQLFKYWIYLLFLSLIGMALAMFISGLRREKNYLHEQKEFFRMIAERTDDLIAVLDLNGLRIYNTLSYRRLFGNIERFKGTHCFNEIHPDDQDRIKRVFNDTVRFGIGQWTEFRFVLADGSVRNMESRGELLRNEQGKAKWVIVVSRDITDRKRIEENYRIANIAFESKDGMFITDVKNVILRVNQSFTEITGYTADDVVGKIPYFLNSDRQIEGLEDAIRDSLNRVGAWRGEVWNRRKNGEEYLEQLTITVVRDDKGNITHYLTLLEDITLRKSEEERIKQLAFHDPLTQLANRRKLLDRLKHSIAIGKREDKKMALLMIDIDRFKAINDIFGNSAGDELLQQVAGKLKARLRDVDLIARFGSDEFIVFLENVGSSENVSRIAESIIFDLSQPFHLTRSNDVRIGVNIGISLYPQHADTAEMLLEQADVALYQAKDAGRGGYVYFSENFIRSL